MRTICYRHLLTSCEWKGQIPSLRMHEITPNDGERMKPGREGMIVSLSPDVSRRGERKELIYDGIFRVRGMDSRQTSITEWRFGK